MEFTEALTDKEEDVVRAYAGESKPHEPKVTESKVTELRPASTTTQPQKTTALQQIAKMILALPWREGEAMGKAIEGKKTEGTSQIAAIMDWAFEWETFKEEERPKG